MRLRKLIVDDGRATRHVMLTGTVTVGRDPSCQICDADPLLSRRHAEFVPDADHVVIRDLGSRNGVLINGVKRPEHVLVPGDLVQLGHLQCRYVEQPAPPAPEPRLAALAQQAAAMPGAPPRGIPVAPAPSRLRDLDDTRPSAAFDGSVPEEPTIETPRLTLDQPPVGDFDVTLAPTSLPAPNAAAGATAEAEATRHAAADPEATRQVTSASAPAAPQRDDVDATMAEPRPVGARTSDSEDLDQTVAPAGPLGAVAAPNAVVGFECEAGLDLKVTGFAAADLDRFGLTSKQILGARITEVPARVLERMATGRGQSAVTCVFERSADGQTITMTMTTGQASGH